MLKRRCDCVAGRCTACGKPCNPLSACGSLPGLGDTVAAGHETHPAHQKPRPPSTLAKAVNFAAAAAKHAAAGMPRATDEEVERRYAICQGCEFLKNDACTKCGCPIARRKKFISKLSWANEKCPVGKW